MKKISVKWKTKSNFFTKIQTATVEFPSERSPAHRSLPKRFFNLIGPRNRPSSLFLLLVKVRHYCVFWAIKCRTLNRGDDFVGKLAFVVCFNMFKIKTMYHRETNRQVCLNRFNIGGNVLLYFARSLSCITWKAIWFKLCFYGRSILFYSVCQMKRHVSCDGIDLIVITRCTCFVHAQVRGSSHHYVRRRASQ